MENSQNNFFNSSDLISKIYVNRKFLLFVIIATALISGVFSFLITPKFKSSVVLFPAQSASIAQSLISSNTYKNNSSIFGEDSEVEQILQVLNSDEIMQRLVSKFDLMKHYEIDENEKYAFTKLQKRYKSNISFKRTEYMAIEISVLDIDPKMAADIANECTSLIDTVLNRMEKVRAAEALKIVEAEFETKTKYMNNLNDSLRKIMAMGIYDYESQSEVYNNAYAEALAKGNDNGAKKLEDKLQILGEYGSNYVAIRDLLTFETEQLSLLNQKLKEARVDAERSLTHIYVVNKATVPDKKYSPKRSLIIIISTISATILAFIGLIFVDLLKTAKENN